MRRLAERLFLALAALILAAPAFAAPPLVLDDRHPNLDAWPAVTILADPTKAMTIDAVRAAAERFAPPTTAPSTLGHRADAVWLRIPFAVAPDSDGHWLLDIEYAPLNRIELHLFDAAGHALQTLRLGNRLPFAERPMPTRTHAAPLSVQPGMAYELWLRVETQGGMIVPIGFVKPNAQMQRALAEQTLQGLLAGLGLCLVLYSLAQWVSLRDALLLKYALLSAGSTLFSVAQFGLGAQYLWTDRVWFEAHVAGLASVVASCGIFLFVEDVLRGPERARWFSPLMKGGAVVLALVGVAYAFDLINLRHVGAAVGTIGLLPALIGLPGAWALARRGDRVGWYLIAAWIGYFASSLLLVSMIRGHAPATFTSLHAFQFGATFDMVVFLRVLALRLHAVHEQAQRAASERDTALSLALSDPLTSLANRRGLHVALERALREATPQRALGVYMIDLDGFKQVNDRHGHEVGDELLVAVAQRLRAALPAGDVIARLGGDEFVIVAAGQADADGAQAIGERVVAALGEPFAVRGEAMSVGATVGYALAPQDGSDATTLLKHADAAMYAGKQAGRNAVRRVVLSKSRVRPTDRAPSRW